METTVIKKGDSFTFDDVFRCCITLTVVDNVSVEVIIQGPVQDDPDETLIIPFDNDGFIETYQDENLVVISNKSSYLWVGAMLETGTGRLQAINYDNYVPGNNGDAGEVIINDYRYKEMIQRMVDRQRRLRAN